jgi:glycosyl transferase family 2
MTTVLHGSTVTESVKGRQQSSVHEQTSDERHEFELTVLIPCLNEQRTIANCVRTALDTMARHAITGEVLVSDNGSTDASVEIAIAAGARVVSCPTRGYGAALHWGFLHAKGRFVLMGDADQSYDFSLLPRFVGYARTGAPFVIGTRIRGRIEKGAMPLLHRYLGTPVLTWILNSLFGTRISDCNCGMRCVDRDTYLNLNLTSPGMEFASEMVVKAAVQGVAITEIPIDFHKDRRDRRPHLRSFRDGWRHLRLLLSHAPDHMMTLPGLCMLAVGFPLVLAQLSGPITLGRAHLDIHYMILGVTLSLIGTSATTLGLVVGSLMPRGSVRLVSWLDKAHRFFSFDNAAALAGVLFVTGFLSDAFVLAHWLYHDQGELTLWFTRLTLFGLVVISMSTQVGFSALLLGTATGSEPVSGIRLVPRLRAEDVTHVGTAS